MKLKIKNPKRFWWIFGSTFLLISLFIIYILCNKNRFISHWSYFSETCQIVEYPDGRFRIYNNEFNEFTTEKMNWIAFAHPNDTMTVFSLKGKRGYLNLITGKFQIQPKYRHAWQFSEGLAAVDDNGKIGFINSKGETCIPFRFFSPHPFKSVADLLFKNGYCTMSGDSGKYGVIDRKGNWVVSPTYDFVNNPVNGYRIVNLGQKYGLLDKQINLILPVEYHHIEIQKEGLLIAKNGDQQLVAFDTKTVIKPFVYDDVADLQYGTGRYDGDGNEILKNTECFAYRIFTKWGLMSRDGKVLTKAIYDGIEGLNNHLFSCAIENYRISVDSKGRIVQ